MNEAVLVAAFMFELNIFQIFGPRNDILFYVSKLFREGIKISCRQYGAISFQYLKQWKYIVLLCVHSEASLFS